MSVQYTIENDARAKVARAFSPQMIVTFRTSKASKNESGGGKDTDRVASVVLIAMSS